MSRPYLAIERKTDRPKIATASPEFPGPTQAALYDDMDRKRQEYLRAYTAWLAQCRPTNEQVTDEAGSLANGMTQIATIMREAKRHG